LIAAPVVIVCCDAGGTILAALTAAIGGWLSGFGGLLTVLLAVAAALTVRSLWRARPCCEVSEPGHGTERKPLHD